MNKILVGIGLIIFFLGLVFATIGLLITKSPEVAGEFFVGAGVMLLGFLLAVAGGFRKD